jgi:hypothetical protein
MTPKPRVGFRDSGDGSHDRLADRDPSALPAGARSSSTATDAGCGPQLLEQRLSFVGQSFQSPKIRFSASFVDIMIDFDQSGTIGAPSLIIDQVDSWLVQRHSSVRFYQMQHVDGSVRSGDQSLQVMEAAKVRQRHLMSDTADQPQAAGLFVHVDGSDRLARNFHRLLRGLLQSIPPPNRADPFVRRDRRSAQLFGVGSPAPSHIIADSARTVVTPCSVAYAPNTSASAAQVLASPAMRAV